MLTYLLGLIIASGALWLLGRRVVEISRGAVAPLFGRSNRTLRIAHEPFTFLFHTFCWLLLTVVALIAGVGLLGMLDPTLLVLPFCGAVVASAIAWILDRASGRSGDEGEGSMEALMGSDRAALEARLETLPWGPERRMFSRALAAWSGTGTDDGYRDAGHGERRARLAELASVAAVERRAFALRGAIGAVGLLPGVTFLLLRDRVVAFHLALLGAALCASLAVGAAVLAHQARRRITHLVDGAAAFLHRS